MIEITTIILIYPNKIEYLEEVIKKLTKLKHTGK